MGNNQLAADEVVLYEGNVTNQRTNEILHVTLTSQKIIFEKELETIDVIPLETVKIYNGTVQVKQKGVAVDIQAISENLTIVFSSIIEARKFTGNIVNAVSGTTLARRNSEKIKDAFNIVDDTLGIDSRSTIKGVLENGIKGTIINGIGKKK